MTTTPRHPLVEEHLAELERRSARLPPGTRRELLAEIRDHVDAGTAEARSEAGIRNMLESLGSPDDISVRPSRTGRPRPRVRGRSRQGGWPWGSASPRSSWRRSRSLGSSRFPSG